MNKRWTKRKRLEKEEGDEKRANDNGPESPAVVKTQNKHGLLRFLFPNNNNNNQFHHHHKLFSPYKNNYVKILYIIFKTKKRKK